MSGSRQLRVLLEYPGLGRPNDVRQDFPGAQAFVDAGLAEWVDPPVDHGLLRAVVVETAEAVPVVETAVARSSTRTRKRTTEAPNARNMG